MNNEIGPESRPKIVELGGETSGFFPYRSVTPEEYVARHSHNIMCFGLDQREYPDPEFNRWIRRVGELLRSREETDRCRREILSPEEYAAVQQAIADIMEHGY
jgi:hypothetical protein